MNFFFLIYVGSKGIGAWRLAISETSDVNCMQNFKTHSNFLAVTHVPIKRTRSMFLPISVLWRKSKICFHRKDRVEKRKTRETALLMGKPFSNYMRVCGKHFKKEDYIYNNPKIFLPCFHHFSNTI
jgi:hypothetical protein